MDQHSPEMMLHKSLGPPCERCVYVERIDLQVGASPLGARRAQTGSGLGRAGMPGEGVRSFVATGPLHDMSEVPL
jgi:hypothetical protein